MDAAYALTAITALGASARKTWKNDTERVAFLFELYQKYTSLLPSEKPKRRRQTKLA